MLLSIFKPIAGIRGFDIKTPYSEKELYFVKLRVGYCAGMAIPYTVLLNFFFHKSDTPTLLVSFISLAILCSAYAIFRLSFIHSFSSMCREIGKAHVDKEARRYICAAVGSRGKLYYFEMKYIMNYLRDSNKKCGRACPS